jgi:hypothetical protein
VYGAGGGCIAWQHHGCCQSPHCGQGL